jgi:uncharacterized protein
MHLAAIASAAALAVAPIPPSPTRWVEDHADLLSPAARDALDARLESYQHATGHQVVVWIGKSLDGAPLADWAVRTFATWEVGRKGFDDGIAMFILADDRAIDIEVGYGLEDKVPDATASRIIREVMAPRLRAGDRDGAVTAGTDAVLTAIEGRPWTGGGAAATEDTPSTLNWILGGLAGIFALILLIRYPRLALWVLWTIVAGGRRGGGGLSGGPSGGGLGSDGGFRGGGGRSGGGGARGSW